MKLTTTQKRAKKFCDNISEYNDGFTNIGVEWVKSRTWGQNPVISSWTGKMTSVSGCGYCKLSTALADVLCFLFPVSSPEFMDVIKTGGCGEYSVMEALSKHGWKLEKTASGKTFDGYRLTRKAV